MGIESRIASKGRMTIPAEIRKRLGLQTGHRIAFVEIGRGYLIVPRNRPVDVLFGSLAEFAISDTTTLDYDEAVGKGASEHAERSRSDDRSKT